MTISAGDQIPRFTVTTMEDSSPTALSSEDLLRGRRVAVLGLPGAFTPVCSSQHLPGFVASAAELTTKGIDAIICVSVNDPFVMDAWGKANGAEDILIVAA